MLAIENNILIQAPAAKVWDALTNPEQTKQYMFGCETVSDWTEGSTLVWRMIHEGQEFIPVKGFIKAIEPGRYLAYTVIDPHNPNLPDVPENYLTVTYTLTEQDGATNLEVSQTGFETAAEGEKRYQDAYNNGEGWNPLLVKIKALVENN
ncbi:SRPBCC family protein [Deminuibacter soli]|uniref:SRPBCC domain-containing protein n=1 Tax=Deminuibacter soli TaxID=2291815 RepID=A0A3E1NKP8_9BACT|nr:SRPBCC domain-containing protein [Deminuibacter soli]RFM28477.1 SRPBCC domain-containing protein [Deminuibacter soli]